MSTVLRGAFSVTRFSFWTGVLLSSLVGALAYVVTEKSIESDAHARFLNHAKYAQGVINARVKSYTDLLRGAASFVQSTEVLTHQQFHEYVRGLDLETEFPAVDSINFAIYFTDDKRQT